MSCASRGDDDPGQRCASAAAREQTAQRTVQQADARLQLLQREIVPIEAEVTAAYTAILDLEQHAFEDVITACLDPNASPHTIDALEAAVNAFVTREQRFGAAELRSMEHMRATLADEMQDASLALKEARLEWEAYRLRHGAHSEEAKYQRSEILRMQQERLELEARTEATILRHARDLFR